MSELPVIIILFYTSIQYCTSYGTIHIITESNWPLPIKFKEMDKSNSVTDIVDVHVW